MRLGLRHRWRALALWLISGAAVTALHAGVLVASLPDSDPPFADDPAGAIVIEFAELPLAAADQPALLTPGPEQVEGKASSETAKEPEKEMEAVEKPVQQADDNPVPEALAAPNPEIPVEQKRPEKELQKPKEAPSQPPAPVTSAPQAISEKLAAVAAAPQQGAPSRNSSNSLPRWTSKISVLLERNKRYPKGARDNRENGVVQVSFSIDRKGRLISSAVRQSSGYGLLDEEALAILRRAQPFPPIPPEVSGERISITVPIRFDSN